MHFATPTAQLPYDETEKVGIVYFRTETVPSSYTEQLFRCRACWERNGVSLGATFLDYGVAANVPLNRRSGFFALMLRLRRGDVSTVIVDDLDRIARDFNMLLPAVRMIEAQAAVLLTADGHRVTATDLEPLSASDHRAALRRRCP